MTKLHQYLINNSSRLKRFAHAVEATLLILVIAGSSAVATYFFMNSKLVDEKQAMREDHLAEIARLQDAYKQGLDRVSTRAFVAATTAENAASAAESATTVANEAATIAKQASAQSVQATKQAVSAVSKAQATVDKVPEPTRAQINRSVDAANRQINK